MRTENQLRLQARRRQGQRGSALLIVLVFAAIVAIMLYRELPVAAFEAQRQKEELLVSRGNEYKRGVKLFVRKVGRFPSSIEELENTNRMRFLRHRYTDPLTGKDDWRIIHAGPGGVIIDSKVQGKSNGKTNALGQGAVFAGFNNTFTGDAGAVADAAPVSAALRQRSAATKNAGSATGDGLNLPPGVGDAAGTDVNAENGQPPGQGPNGPGQASQSSQLANGQGGGGSGSIGPDGLPAPAAPGAGIGSVSQQLNNVNPKTPEQAQSSAFGTPTAPGAPPNVTQGVGNGQIMAAGGIAGVASKAPGKSIKTVNDQTKYSLWEFYYDLQKDQSAGAAAATGLQQNGQANGLNGNNQNGLNGNNGQNGLNGNNNNQGSAFGQTQQSGQSQSGFGFGGTNSQQGAQQAPPPTPMQPPPQQ